MGKRKNKAAVALGARSWRGLSPEERSERARKTREKQLAGVPEAERSEIMRALVKRRWKTKKAGSAAAAREPAP